MQSNKQTLTARTSSSVGFWGVAARKTLASAPSAASEGDTEHPVSTGQLPATYGSYNYSIYVYMYVCIYIYSSILARYHDVLLFKLHYMMHLLLYRFNAYCCLSYDIIYIYIYTHIIIYIYIYIYMYIYVYKKAASSSRTSPLATLWASPELQSPHNLGLRAVSTLISTHTLAQGWHG